MQGLVTLPLSKDLRRGSNPYFSLSGQLCQLSY